MRSLSVLMPLVVWTTVTILSAGDNPLEVKTKSGKVKGHTESTAVGDVDAFLGIPYGAAADGKNRFAPPKEVEPWNGVLDATKPPRPCYQIIDPKWRGSGLISKQKETENCLTLNIWVPRPRPKKSAVMVWIHGGGFACGSNDIPLYRGAVLAAQEDIILVSVNYRLSGLGFLYLGHPLAPGNVGLMDQALGLQWVKKNIRAFGGDPERVTIFGESAGGASVGLQLLAPSSLDHFKNAIMQSGSAATFWAADKPEDALKQSLALAENFGCPTNLDQSEEIVQCLQDVDVDKLAEVMISMEGTLRMVFKPVVDGKFLPQDPSKLLTEGKFCGEKNILIGYTREDGSFVLPMAPAHRSIRLNEDTVYTEEQLRQLMTALTYTTPKVIHGLQLDLVKHVYTDWESYPHDRIAARAKFVQYLTDRWFACGAVHTADKMSGKGNNVFFFRFDHIPDNHIMPFKYPSWMGSTHADELAFVFGNLLQNNNQESTLSKQMMRYWAHFAKHSDPNDGYLPTWPKYNSKEKLMLLFDDDGLAVEKNDRTKECAFWQNVFPNVADKPKDEL